MVQVRGKVNPDAQALNMKKNNAFTLIELILVVTVITTLALIAMPNYGKAKKRALEKEAIASLKLMAAGERIYRMEQLNYVACSCTNTTNCVNTSTGCNYILKLMLNPTNWTYSSDGSGNIVAQGVSATGLSSCNYSLAPSGYDGEPTAAAGCP